MKTQSVVGTNDWIGEDLLRRQKVSDVFSKIMKRFNVESVELPILEKIETFQKNLGDSSDIVQKEMFVLNDMVLRPEGTAGVVRALCSGWEQKLPLKLSYDGAMFRKETPQKGRFRQFDQVGLEMLGYKAESGDSLSLLCAYEFLKALRLEKQVKLQINYLGTKEERENYKKSLIAYFSSVEDQLSEESKSRLQTNVLRILDSKQTQDQKVVLTAPNFSSFLGEESKKSLSRVCDALTKLEISFSINEKLVRGLDYYTGLVFEFISSNLGSQGTVLAGGRYDDLVANMGGPSTPCIGWAAGKERLAMLIEKPEVESKIFGICVTDEAYMPEALALAKAVVEKTSWQVEIPPNESIGKKMKKLNKVGAKFVAILGPDEMSKGVFSLKDMTSGVQEEKDLKGILIKLLVTSLGDGFSSQKT